MPKVYNRQTGTIDVFPQDATPQEINSAMGGTADIFPDDANDQEIKSALNITDQAKPSSLEALGRGAGQGITFGFSDEALAALRSISPDVTYKQALGEERQKLAQAQEAHPYLYTGADIASSMLLPMGAIGKAGVIGTQAALGGLQALGRTEGNITDIGNLAQVGLGAGLGAGGAKLAQLIKPQAVKKIAEEQAFMSMQPTAAEIKALKFSGKTPQKVGAELIEQGVMKKPFSDVQDMLKVIRDTTDESGKVISKGLLSVSGENIGKALGEVDSVVTQVGIKAQKSIYMSGKELSNMLMGVSDDMASTGTRYDPSDFTKLNNFAERIAQKYKNKRLTFQQFNDELSELGKKGQFEKEAMGSKEVLNQAWHTMRDLLDAKVSEAGDLVGAGSLETLKKAKSSFSNLATAKDILTRAMETEQSRRLMAGLFPALGAGGIGWGVTGDIKKGAGTAVLVFGGAKATGLVRKYGSQQLSKLAQNAVKHPERLEYLANFMGRGQKPYILGSDIMRRPGGEE